MISYQSLLYSDVASPLYSAELTVTKLHGYLLCYDTYYNDCIIVSVAII